MARHKNQTLGYGRPFGSGKPPTPHAATLLARSKGKLPPASFNGIEFPTPRPLKPPHRHVFEGGVCKVCQAQEIEST